eukprot:g41900.t1
MRSRHYCIPLRKLGVSHQEDQVLLTFAESNQTNKKITDNSNLANYCPIIVLSIISKVMEGVINSAVKQDLLSNNLLSDAQFVFGQSHSTADLITAMVLTWTKELNSRGEVKVTALDIKA